MHIIVRQLPIAESLLKFAVLNGGDLTVQCHETWHPKFDYEYVIGPLGLANETTTPLSLMSKNPELLAELRYLPRMSVIMFFEAVCLIKEAVHKSLQQTASNIQVVRQIAKFL